MKRLNTASATRALIHDLESHLPELMAKHKVPGISLALVRQAEIVWNRSFGVRDCASGEALTPETVFEAASLSKPVFCYGVLKLCEAGRFSLDDPLAGHLPEPYLPDEEMLARITLRHVLSHTPGFPNWRPEGQPLKIHFPPGERFSYSGEGYVYLQTVLAHILAQDPAAYLREHLLERLGMNHSAFTWNRQVDWPVAIGHDSKGHPREKWLCPEMNAAASLHCTAEDYARFLCAVLVPSPGNPAHLGPEIIREMLKPQVQVNDSAPWHKDWPKAAITLNEQVAWGLGWGLQHSTEGPSIWHWGDNGGYKAFVVADTLNGDGVIILTNGQNGQRVINTILYDLVGGEYPGLDWLMRMTGD